jgi:hypothetical protein
MTSALFSRCNHPTHQLERLGEHVKDVSRMASQEHVKDVQPESSSRSTEQRPCAALISFNLSATAKNDRGGSQNRTSWSTLGYRPFITSIPGSCASIGPREIGESRCRNER